MRFLFVLLAFLLLFNTVFGLYNDAGNDSCLTIYSDKKDYAVGRIDSAIKAELVFDNRCSKEIKDLKLGLFLENEILSDVSFEAIYNFSKETEEVKTKSFVCNYTLTTASITKQTTCTQTIIDANLSKTVKTLWAGIAESVEGNIINWVEKVVKPAKWNELTAVFKPSTDIDKIDGKPDFELMVGWQEITLPVGETKLKVTFNVPIGYKGKREFIIKAVSDKDSKIFSVLDPDWYDADCAYRKKITLKTSDYLTANVTNDHIIYVKQIATDTDFWGHETTGDHVRFTAADGSTLLKYYFQRFDNANDLMDAWVKVTDTFTSGANVDIYMYYGCAGFSDGQDATNTLTNALSVYHADEGTDTTISDKKGAYNATASSASIWDTTTQKIGAGGLNFAELYYATQGTLLDTMPTDLSIEMWIKPNASYPSGSGAMRIFTKVNIFSPENMTYSTFTKQTGLLTFSGNVDNVDHVISSVKSSWTADTWYHVIYTWNTTAGMRLFFDGVLDAEDATLTTLMANGTGTDFFLGANWNAANKWNGKMDEVKFYSVGIDANEAMLLYRSENSNLQVYGGEEINNTAPDLNFWKIGGFDLNGVLPFFKADVNLAITFSVFDKENDRLSVDFNYNAVQARGGNVIVDDLNLNADVCVSTVFSEVSSCVWDWNTNVADGNYFLVSDLFDGFALDFNISIKNIGIDGNAPAVVDSYLRNDLNAADGEFTFWVKLTDSASGVKGAWWGKFKNGVLDSNGFSDANADGFALVTLSLDENLDSAFVVWYGFSDNVDNNWNQVIKSGLYTRIYSAIISRPTQRFFAQNDFRPVDSNRFIAGSDSRLSDSTRFLTQDDVRVKTISIEESRVLLENTVFSWPTILLYISIVFIILSLICWKLKK